MTDWPDEAASSLVSLKVCFDADKRMEYRCSLRPVPKSTQGFISIAETVRRLSGCRQRIAGSLFLSSDYL